MDEAVHWRRLLWLLRLLRRRARSGMSSSFRCLRVGSLLGQPLIRFAFDHRLAFLHETLQLDLERSLLLLLLLLLLASQPLSRLLLFLRELLLLLLALQLSSRRLGLLLRFLLLLLRLPPRLLGSAQLPRGAIELLRFSVELDLELDLVLLLRLCALLEQELLSGDLLSLLPRMLSGLVGRLLGLLRCLVSLLGRVLNLARLLHRNRRRHHSCLDAHVLVVLGEARLAPITIVHHRRRRKLGRLMGEERRHASIRSALLGTSFVLLVVEAGFVWLVLALRSVRYG